MRSIGIRKEEREERKQEHDMAFRAVKEITGGLDALSGLRGTGLLP